MPSKYTSNAWKKYAKGEDKDTLKLKDWFRDLCRRRGYNFEEEKKFPVNFHDTNELAEDKEIPFPVDGYISHRKKPDFQKIIEIDGEYHEEPEQRRKDAERDAAIEARYGIKPQRFAKKALLKQYTEQQLVDELGI